MNQHLQVCKNCGHQFQGRYCNECGEKVYTGHDKSLVHLLEEGFHFLTHFEGSFFTTIKTVIRTPGRFSLDYCNGIRKKYFKPVSLFLMFVVLYLLFPRFQGLNMKLDTYVTDIYGFTWASVPLVKAKMKSKQVDYKEVARQYNAKSPSVSKIFLFSLIPLGALVLMLLFFNTKRYFFDHTILSLELSSLFIGLHFLVIPFVSFLVATINPQWERFFWDGNNRWLSYPTLALNLLIVSVACKRFYGQQWLWTIPKAAIFLFAFGELVYYVYRLLVLVVTLMIL